jgi:ABC-type uncharacterized transport system permease subunit
MTTGTSPVARSHRIKQGKASLVVGIAVGIAVLVLWIGITHELGADSVVVLAAGVLVAAGVAAWIKRADL